MEPFQVDLTNCDREPIHIPGKIQAHGFLVAVDQATFIINYISTNTAGFVGKEAAHFLGKPIADLESCFQTDANPNELSSLLNLLKSGKQADSINPHPIRINQNTYNLIVSAADDELILEFEPVTSDLDFDVQKTIGKSVSGILSGKNLSSLLDNAAAEIKKIIHFDRVMIYKFNEDGHGRVVAEVVNEGLDPFLDLYYPATDIPKQARELYKINLTRLIADVNSDCSPIITLQDQDTALNLSHSSLRAVSPIHIQYLKNMGVESSFSISLMAKGELWGLVACHNYSPRFINYKARDAAKLIGQILSSALEYRQEEEDTELLRTLDVAGSQLSKQIKSDDNIVEALTAHPVTLKNLTTAAGAVLMFNNQITRVGITPDDEQIKEITIWLKSHLEDSVYYTNRLPELFLPAKKYSNLASGMLACVISKELNEWLLWFKPEQIESITWAGNPEKPVEQNEYGLMQLSPRKSFEAWTEIVKNTSEKWSTKEVSVVMKIREEILDSINRKANEIRLLNDRLQLAYDELDTFTYTISHDLRTPLSAVKSYSELLLATNKSLDDGARKILDRVVAGADKMNFLIKEILHYSRVGRAEFEPAKINMSELLEDIKQEVTVALKPQHLELTFGDLPDIFGDKTMISQVFTNLLNNAIKYSSKSNPSKIKVEGKIDRNEVVYSVADNGVGIDINFYNRVFELFKRMDNVQDVEGTGVGLAIVKRIIEKHQARIWFESELNIGTVFYIAFKIN
ncbi:MAG: GAF domain-containing protein [Sphingobacteriaceae bacterium]|nr:MAG: GAF domain-containing protein [Sphingobacteriaceae bacterium]